MKAYIYSNDTAEMQLFSGETTGTSGGKFTVTPSTSVSGMTRGAKYKYSLGAPNVNIATATLTSIDGSTYTFTV
ncbi:hypothetical protein ABH926_010170 [Catenulispora sp. GP43]|uniref:hypothetical protein n=1 Tax=Catenulispora sp. GP43 TaxID=3156263 RepID=UPI0035142330